MKDSEKLIERKLTEATKRMGGMAIKLSADGVNGVPDRVILLPNGKAYLVETKSQGDKPRRIQRYMHDKLAAMGHEVIVIDNLKQLNKIIQLWTKETE